jgi:hypothetical protein
VLLPGLRRESIGTLPCIGSLASSSKSGTLVKRLFCHPTLAGMRLTMPTRRMRLSARPVCPIFVPGRIAEKSRDGEDRIELIGCGVVCFIKVSKPVAVFGLN